MHDIPLGKSSDYPDRYSPDLLAPIPRGQARDIILTDQDGDDLPFRGVDIWNAWELTWLSPGGKPEVRTAEIAIPATSPNIVESKSMKLYLNSFAMSEYASPDEVRTAIQSDISAAAGENVDVTLRHLDDPRNHLSVMPGACIDALSAACRATDVNPDSLGTIGGEVIEESLHTHLLRSLCPVTAQPDFASLLLSYRGRRIDTVGLLQYIVSFRRHQDFHEACVERMFLDILERCECEKLTVYARYTRRGGIDINPWRSNGTGTPENLRVWRQ